MAYVLKIRTEKCTSAPPCKSPQTNKKHTPAFAQGAGDTQDPAGESDDAEDSHEKSMSLI